MTGEITLRGRVLPIGGLKEKLLAASAAGIKTVVIPEENVKDLAEIGDEVKAQLEIVPASRMDDVLKIALQRVPNPIGGRKRRPHPVPAGRRRGRARRALPRIKGRRLAGSVAYGDRVQGHFLGPAPILPCSVQPWLVAALEIPRKYGAFRAFSP